MVAITILGSNPSNINKTPNTAPGEHPAKAAANDPKNAINWIVSKLLLLPVKSPSVKVYPALTLRLYSLLIMIIAKIMIMMKMMAVDSKN